MTDDARQLRRRLKALGLSDAAVAAAWPRWWTDEAEASRSARAELRFGVARRLGIDPRSLLKDDAGAPRFMWRDEAHARFKHLSGETPTELAGITSFGQAVGTTLSNGLQARQTPVALPSALELRKQILEGGQPYVTLTELLAVCWALSIPAVHLRVFPWPQKRMAAMSVRTPTGWAILLGKDSLYPAVIAFYLAHELAHIALGHVEGQIVDLEDEGPTASDRDAEDQAADAYALKVLTGEDRPTVLPADPRYVSGTELARRATNSAAALGIEPGTIALLFGYSTANWSVATAALRRIYGGGAPIWQLVNGVALRELGLDQLPTDSADFLRAVLGETTTA